MNLPQEVLKNTYILTNKFKFSGVGLFLMKSTFTVLIQIEDRGLNEDIELVNLLRRGHLRQMSRIIRRENFMAKLLGKALLIMPPTRGGILVLGCACIHLSFYGSIRHTF